MVDDLIKNAKIILRRPTRLKGVLNKFGLKINQKIHSFNERDGYDVTEKEWDNLLILDSCRYDSFKQHSTFEGQLSKQRSVASHSKAFLEENFHGREFHDTIYITANPFANEIPENTFFDMHQLLESDWDEELRTVPPKAVVERTLKIHQENPNKRLIVHFMQPHIPFIGEEWNDTNQAGLREGAKKNKAPVGNYHGIWTQILFNLNNITLEEAIDGYHENLEIVLSEIEYLIHKLDGKSVITADHGNLLGERLSPVPIRGYGHPQGLFVDKLVQVPWQELPFDERRDIVVEDPISTDRHNVGVREDQLIHLGYK